MIIQPLLTPNDIALLKELGEQEQDDKVIVECLLNTHTLQVYYIFELNEMTNIAKCYTNNDFKKEESINLNEMQKNPFLKRKKIFERNLISEIANSKSIVSTDKIKSA